MKNLISLLLIILFVPLVNGQNEQDNEVIQAVLDYADGYYSGNPDRIGAVLHPDFVKIKQNYPRRG